MTEPIAEAAARPVPLLLWWWPETLTIHYTYVQPGEDPRATNFYPRATYLAQGWYERMVAAAPVADDVVTVQ